MDTSSDLILTRIESAVGSITLNRPEALNAFNLVLAKQFSKAIDDFNRNTAVRVIVIRGVGRVFSAGGDVKEMLGYVKGPTPEQDQQGTDRATYFREPLAAFGEIIVSLRGSPKPVLAAVHGAVAGVAFNLMLACDMVLAEEKTRFSQAFIKLGLSPDGGGTWFLPRLLGHARASELTMLPTELDAQKALSWGLVNWVVPQNDFETKLADIAARLVDGPSQAIARTKSLLRSTYDHVLSEHIELERLAQVENASHRDFEEGLVAFVEKRAPRFRTEASS
jgi:2-(1,2-epoxy-1,2-dihydrophenyl)acetyl-CoA isomerase